MYCFSWTQMIINVRVRVLQGFTRSEKNVAASRNQLVNE